MSCSSGLIRDDPSQGQFHGSIVKHRQLEGAVIVVTEANPIAAASKGRHSHENPYFWILLDGDCSETIDGVGERIYRPMVPTYHPAGEIHAHHRGPRQPRGVGIVLTGNLKTLAEEMVPRVEEPEVHPGPEACDVALRIARELSHDDRSSSLALEGLCIELIAYTGRTPYATSARAPAWLAAAKSYLVANAGSKLKLTDIAAEVGIHPVHLSTEFRRHFGCTVGNFVRSARVEAAKTRLGASEDSIAAIASESGFFDEAHFCRVFKSLTGATPTQYRRSLKS